MIIVPREPIAADWPTDKVRYFFLDNDSGDDTNVGYIDDDANTEFTAAQSSAVALKTSEELRARLPAVGDERTAVVLIKPRSDAGNYLAADGATQDHLWIGYLGYRYLAFRGSDLTNSDNDHVDLGGVTAEAGPNSDGSWTVSSFATHTITVAAGTLPAEDDIGGLKVEYQGNTTAALRTQGNTIIARGGATTCDIGYNALGTPTTGDKFYLRRPGVKFATVKGSPWGGDGSNFSFPSTHLCGLEFTGTTIGVYPSTVGHTFVRFAGTCNFTGFVWTSTSYSDEGTGFPLTQCGLDARGSWVSAGGSNGLTSPQSVTRLCGFHGSTTFTAHGPSSIIAEGSFVGSTCIVQMSVGGLSKSTGQDPGVIFGSASSADFRYTRAVSGVQVKGGVIAVRGVDLDGATNGVVITGQHTSITLMNVSGTCGTSGLDLQSSTGAYVTIISGVTMTGTSQDILLASAQTKTFASLASDHWIDAADNRVFGSGGNTEPRLTAGGSSTTQVADLESQHSVASTTATEVTGLQISLSAAGTYMFRYYLIVRSSAASVGLKFGVNYTGTTTKIVAHMRAVTTGTTAATGIWDDVATTNTGQLVEGWVARAVSTTAANLGPAAGVAATAQNILCVIEGVIVVSDTGDLELWHGSESATATTVEVGSSVEVVKTS